MSALSVNSNSPRSIEIVTMLGDSVVNVAHCVDPRDGRTSRITRALFVGGALALVAAIVAFVASVSAARDDERAFQQWTKVERKPAGAFRHHHLGAGYDVVAFGGFAVGLGALAFGLARARRERRKPSFRVGSAPNVDQPIDRDGSFPLVAPGGDDFVFHHGPGITAELLDGPAVWPLVGAPSPTIADAFEIAIPSTGRIRARAGQTTFFVSAVARPRGAAVPLLNLDRRAMAYVAGSLAAHLAILGLLQLVPVDVGVAGVDYSDAEHATPSAHTPSNEDVTMPPDNTGESTNDSGGATTQVAMADPGQRGMHDAVGSDARQRVRDNHVQPQLSREEVLEQMRRAGILGSSMLDGAIADVTSNGYISSGLDDVNAYGGEFGDGDGRPGFGTARDGTAYGGEGWGVITYGRYGVICGRGQTSCGGGYESGYGPNGSRGPLKRDHAKTDPVVRIGEPGCGSEGCGPDKELIRRYIKRSKDKIAYCYEKALLANPALAGEITAEFFIMPDGMVKGSQASGFDDDIAGCVAGVVAKIEFPKLGDGAGVHVHYPFTFRRTGA